MLLARRSDRAYWDQETINGRYNENEQAHSRVAKKIPPKNWEVLLISMQLKCQNFHASLSCWQYHSQLTDHNFFFFEFWHGKHLYLTKIYLSVFYVCQIFFCYIDATSIAVIAMGIVLILQESWLKVITYYIFSEEKSGRQVLIILVKIVPDTVPRNPVKLHQRLIFLIIIF